MSDGSANSTPAATAPEAAMGPGGRREEPPREEEEEIAGMVIRPDSIPSSATPTTNDPHAEGDGRAADHPAPASYAGVVATAAAAAAAADDNAVAESAAPSVLPDDWLAVVIASQQEHDASAIDVPPRSDVGAGGSAAGTGIGGKLGGRVGSVGSASSTAGAAGAAAAAPSTAAGGAGDPVAIDLVAAGFADVATIPSGFAKGLDVEQLVLPPSLTELGDGVCEAITTDLATGKGLRVLDLSLLVNLRTIGARFAARSDVERLAMPAASKAGSVLRDIGSGFLQMASRLVAVDLGDSTAIRAIDDSFCADASTLAKVSLPPNITAIGDAFCRNTRALKELRMARCTALREVGSSFLAGTALPTIVLPTHVETVGRGFGFAARGLTTVDCASCHRLTSLPSSFLTDSSVTRVRLPPRLESVGDRFLAGATRLVHAELRSVEDGQQQQHGLVSGGIGSTVGGAASVSGGAGAGSKDASSTNGLAADAFFGGALTTIGDDCLAGCTSLETVGLPSTLTALGTGFAEGTTALERATLAAARGLLDLPDRTLFNSAVAELRLPLTLETIGNGVLSKATALATLDLSGHRALRSIGDECLYKAAAVEVIYLAPSLQRTGARFAASCPKLRFIGGRDCRSLQLIGPRFAASSSVIRIDLAFTPSAPQPSADVRVALSAIEKRSGGGGAHIGGAHIGDGFAVDTHELRDVRLGVQEPTTASGAAGGAGGGGGWPAGHSADAATLCSVGADFCRLSAVSRILPLRDERLRPSLSAGRNRRRGGDASASQQSAAAATLSAGDGPVSSVLAQAVLPMGIGPTIGSGFLSGATRLRALSLRECGRHLRRVRRDCLRDASPHIVRVALPHFSSLRIGRHFCVLSASAAGATGVTAGSAISSGAAAAGSSGGGRRLVLTGMSTATLQQHVSVLAGLGDGHLALRHFTGILNADDLHRVALFLLSDGRDVATFLELFAGTDHVSSGGTAFGAVRGLRGGALRGDGNLTLLHWTVALFPHKLGAFAPTEEALCARTALGYSVLHYAALYGANATAIQHLVAHVPAQTLQHLDDDAVTPSTATDEDHTRHHHHHGGSDPTVAAEGRTGADDNDHIINNNDDDSAADDDDDDDGDDVEDDDTASDDSSSTATSSSEGTAAAAEDVAAGESPHQPTPQQSPLVVTANGSGSGQRRRFSPSFARRGGFLSSGPTGGSFDDADTTNAVLTQSMTSASSRMMMATSGGGTASITGSFRRQQPYLGSGSGSGGGGQHSDEMDLEPYVPTTTPLHLAIAHCRYDTARAMLAARGGLEADPMARANCEASLRLLRSSGFQIHRQPQRLFGGMAPAVSMTSSAQNNSNASPESPMVVGVRLVVPPDGADKTKSTSDDGGGGGDGDPQDQPMLVVPGGGTSDDENGLWSRRAAATAPPPPTNNNQGVAVDVVRPLDAYDLILLHWAAAVQQRDDDGQQRLRRQLLPGTIIRECQKLIEGIETPDAPHVAKLKGRFEHRFHLAYVWPSFAFFALLLAWLVISSAVMHAPYSISVTRVVEVDLKACLPRYSDHTSFWLDAVSNASSRSSSSPWFGCPGQRNLPFAPRLLEVVLEHRQTGRDHLGQPFVHVSYRAVETASLAAAVANATVADPTARLYVHALRLVTDVAYTGPTAWLDTPVAATTARDAYRVYTEFVIPRPQEYRFATQPADVLSTDTAAEAALPPVPEQRVFVRPILAPQFAHVVALSDLATWRRAANAAIVLLCACSIAAAFDVLVTAQQLRQRVLNHPSRLLVRPSRGSVAAASLLTALQVAVCVQLALLVRSMLRIDQGILAPSPQWAHADVLSNLHSSSRFLALLAAVPALRFTRHMPSIDTCLTVTVFAGGAVALCVAIVVAEVVPAHRIETAASAVGVSNPSPLALGGRSLVSVLVILGAFWIPVLVLRSSGLPTDAARQWWCDTLNVMLDRLEATASPSGNGGGSHMARQMYAVIYSSRLRGVTVAVACMLIAGLYAVCAFVFLAPYVVDSPLGADPEEAAGSGSTAAAPIAAQAGMASALLGFA